VREYDGTHKFVVDAELPSDQIVDQARVDIYFGLKEVHPLVDVRRFLWGLAEECRGGAREPGDCTHAQI
jgi:hypothetical protein